MSLDLEKMEKQLDEALKKETKESLLKWLDEQKTRIERQPKAVGVQQRVIVQLTDILKILDNEEYTISVFGNCPIDDKIAESISNNAIIDFKKQLRETFISKLSE